MALPCEKVRFGEAPELCGRLGILSVGVRQETPAGLVSQGSARGFYARRQDADQLSCDGDEYLHLFVIEDGGQSAVRGPYEGPQESAFARVAQRPKSCRASTWRSISSRVPVATTARPLV